MENLENENCHGKVIGCETFTKNGEVSHVFPLGFARFMFFVVADIKKLSTLLQVYGLS